MDNTRHRTHFHENPPQTSASEHGFRFWKVAISYGVLGGVLMGLYLLLLNMASDDPSSWLKFSKHLIMIPIMGVVLKQYKAHLPEGKIFKDGIKLSAAVATLAAFTLIIFDHILWFVAPEISFEQFMNENNSYADLFINDSYLAVETWVFTMVTGFVWLQWIKDAKQPDG